MATTKKPFGKILVVDDEVELKNALVEVLLNQSYDVRGCVNGYEALEALRREDFDLMITDLMMPEMDGVALIKAALQIDPNLVPIVMTGSASNDSAAEAKKVGAFEYVLKPFRLKTLMPVLKRALHTRQLASEDLTELEVQRQP